MKGDIKLEQFKSSLGGIGLRLSPQRHLKGYGSTFEQALESLKSVYRWERCPFPSELPEPIQVKE